MVLKVPEDGFMTQVTQLAELCGWKWVHFRPAKTSRGWRTPVSGPLGKGWPDLTLTRIKDGRVIFAELKSASGKLDDDQTNVLRHLEAVAANNPLLHVAVWGPSDFDDVLAALR